MHATFMRLTLFIALIYFIGCNAFAISAPTIAKLQFNRDVRPILSENCFSCHGFDPKNRKAELRLDLAEEAYKTRKDSTAIVPHDLAKSDAWQRILSTDPDDQMPPPKSHLKLSDTQCAILKQWIEEGAEYQGHWSFIAPVKAVIPKVEGAGPDASPIDAFILDRLGKEHLTSSPEADRATLIRRVTLDLTGLPPSAREVERFSKDTDPQAYEKWVDYLLASSQFGERLALDWMDVARYADTNGFSIDGGRHMWLWRDWVINAFNTNKPFDQFLTEQLAGDLIPDAKPEQIIATGFCRNHMITHEGGTIPEENLTNYCVDRVKTTAEAFLGLTMGCAQCHDHKYDPISQRDYYRFFAYFNTVDDQGLDGDRGINAKPFMQARTMLKTGEEAEINEQIKGIVQQMETPVPASQVAWEKSTKEQLSDRGKGFALHPVELLKVTTPNRGNGFEVENSRFVRITEAGGIAAYDIALKVPEIKEPVTGIRVVFHPDPSLPGGGLGHGSFDAKPKQKGKPAEPIKEPGTFMVTGVTTSAGVVNADQVDLYHVLKPKTATASSAMSQFLPEQVLDGRNEFGWSPAKDATGPQHLTVTFAAPLSTKDTPFMTTQVNFGHGNNLIAGRMEIFLMTGHDDDSNVPEDVQAIFAQEPDKRSQEQTRKLQEFYTLNAPEFAEQRVALVNLKERLEVLNKEFPTMVMNVSAKPRETHILHRGDYAQPTEAVSAGTLSTLPSAPEGAPESRLGLAQWFTMPGNPLTARVAVNRYWQMLFGTGIVATVADFGSQGEWPSHPELLDWLAVEFRESGWNVKVLIKKMVMSSTYRQSSHSTTAMLERDPANRLLARGPRFRLSAEFIRDGALKVSGLLVPRIGGPSVNPYQPGDLWREISHYGSTPATAQTFVQDHGEKLHRRSLYTYWKRTVPPPNMAAFDAPNREICTVSRAATNTPLQALVLLNDTQFVEASRVFAERALKQEGNDESRLRFAFAEATGREPSKQELVILSKALVRERARYAKDETAAKAYLNIGEAPRDKALSPREHAAWTSVMSLVLNLSETVTRS